MAVRHVTQKEKRCGALWPLTVPPYLENVIPSSAASTTNQYAAAVANKNRTTAIQRVFSRRNKSIQNSTGVLFHHFFILLQI